MGLDFFQGCGLAEPRRVSDAQGAEIAASIRAFGWTNPVLVDGENGIIAGHSRVLAARKLGLHTVPVIELAGMSEAEKRAYVIADNKLALKAGWDEEMLAAEIGDLQALGFDLARTGFEGAESLFRKATGDGSQSVTAAIFWLKTWGSWRETSHCARMASPICAGSQPRSTLGEFVPCGEGGAFPAFETCCIELRCFDTRESR